MSFQLKLSLCDDLLSGIRPSVRPSDRPSVCKHLSVNWWTNLDGKTYKFHMWSEDTLGDWLLPIIELGHSDLLCEFFRAKFTFPMYSNSIKICLYLNGFWPNILINRTIDFDHHDFHLKNSCLTLNHFSRLQQSF